MDTDKHRWETGRTFFTADDADIRRCLEVENLDTSPKTLTPRLSHPMGEGGVGLSPVEAEREKEKSHRPARADGKSCVPAYWRSGL